MTKRKLYTPQDRSKWVYEVLMDGETEWKPSNASSVKRALKESGLAKVNAGETVESGWGHLYKRSDK